MTTATRVREAEQPRPPRFATAEAVRRPHLVPEVLLVFGTYLAYTLGRYLAAKHTSSAYEHASTIWNFERLVHLPNEATVQSWALHWPRLLDWSNLYYQLGYAVSLVVTLVWLYVRQPAYYLWYRRLLTIVTGLALLGHIFYPMAPPRLLTGDGVVDTAVVYGHAVYGPVGTGLSNQYAAMPSLHVGWAIVVAVGVIVVLRSRWRWLSLLHPVLTLLIVVITGNHYWMDGIVGGLLVAFGSYVAYRWLPQGERSGSATPAKGQPATESAADAGTAQPT